MHRWALALWTCVLLALAAASAQGDETTQLGAFFVIEGDPYSIYLEGEIVDGSALDFLRALRMRPEARVLVLDSSGGLVDDALVIAHEVQERSLSTFVPEEYGCYSACAYIYFAGRDRRAVGELGVHQVYGEGVDAQGAQTALSDVLDALSDFGVSQGVISLMLRTPPESMYVFSSREVDDLKINKGENPDFTRFEVASGQISKTAKSPNCRTIQSTIVALTACIANEWHPIDGIGAQEFSYMTEDENFGLMVITEREIIKTDAFRAAIIENAVIGSGGPRDSIKVVGERTASVGGRSFDVISYTIPNGGDPILFQNFYYSRVGFGSLQILAYSLLADGWATAAKAELFNSTVRLND